MYILVYLSQIHFNREYHCRKFVGRLLPCCASKSGWLQQKCFDLLMHNQINVRYLRYYKSRHLVDGQLRLSHIADYNTLLFLVLLALLKHNALFGSHALNACSTKQKSPSSHLPSISTSKSFTTISSVSLIPLAYSSYSSSELSCTIPP